MTTVVLWPSRQNPFVAANLLGKPVWRRTLDALGALSPRHVVWVGGKAPSGLDALPESRLGSIRGPLIIAPAGLACVSPRALKRLAKESRRRPRALFRGDGGNPVVIATEGAMLKNLKARSVSDVALRLKPDPVFTDDDDLHIVDSAETWSEAHRILRSRKATALLRRGVLIPDPTTVSIDPEVSVGAGTVLSPFVLLEGDSRVGTGCTIGSFSHLVNATVGTGTNILDHCFIRDSRIGKNASIGPFAHLRPDCDVGDAARVGNFVELKKAKLRAGAKAPHLSYIGDAEVGKNANLGAGTITCNYDGRVKSRTIVGDDAFIGSDVQLVAPVRVGKGAFVAAGSCIVEDVPAGSLAVARSRQVIKKGWAKRRQKR
jgi:acetyltransferase-like isoleucine patch superfamily enzyme